MGRRGMELVALRERAAEELALAWKPLAILPLLVLLSLPLAPLPWQYTCHAALLTPAVEQTHSGRGDSVQDLRLGPAPTLDIFPTSMSASPSIANSAALAATATSTAAATGLRVNPSTRAASKAFYWKYYAARKPAVTWTGSQAICAAGTTSPNFRHAVLLRVNYFRAMAGVPAGVTLSAPFSAKAQQAALMMSANAGLSHSPPPSWRCYTKAGADAAGSSNLALGLAGWEAITGYMEDPGSGNEVVGHRRWILYPNTRQMGTGDVPVSRSGSGFPWLANALWVFDLANMRGPRPATRQSFIAWPPPGFVPYTVVFPRWSFSFPKASFANARVAMLRNGRALPLTRYNPVDGYGDNTLVWELASIPKPLTDTRYTVTITGALVNGQARRFSYVVTVFDPAN